MSLIISPGELQEMLAYKSEVLLVDTRTFSEYSESHIRGSVNIDLMQFHWVDSSPVGIRDFNRQARLLLSNIGIRPSKMVVFYDNLSGMSAARGVWLLLYFSHRKVAMLDGGFQEWTKAGYETEKKTNGFLHSKFVGRPSRKILADYKEVKRAIGKEDFLILDVRSKMEYKGIVTRAAKAGHVPGAQNVDWVENLDGNSFKTQKRLRRLYKDIPQKKIILTYCQGGYRAANTFVALREIGYDKVKMYLGSWGEWGNRPELPVEK